MAQPAGSEGCSTDDQIHRAYIMDVRIVEVGDSDDQTRHCFEAPEHEGRTFEDADTAELCMKSEHRPCWCPS